MKRTLSLNRNNDFRRLYNRGKSFVNSCVVVYYFRNRLTTNRLGITVSKKIGNAVVRNRARRIIKEAYRLKELTLPIGYDFVFVARKGVTSLKTGDIITVIEKLVIVIEKQKI